MKKNILYILLASLMILPGCADYLDQDPEDLNSLEKIFSSDVQTRKWYARMYSTDFLVTDMHYSGQVPYFWTTDEAAYTMESFVRSVSEGRVSPDNNYGYTGYNLYFFVRYYQAIRHINLFLENVDDCNELGETERRQYKAEARFMRAYYHWLLVRLYGPVPIIEKSRAADQVGARQARNTFAECIEWIDNEMNWACDNGLIAKRPESQVGLPDQGAARAIQSRMHLLAASPLYNGNTVYANWKNNDGTVLIPQTYDKELWKKAADAAKAVIDLEYYDLKKPEDGVMVHSEEAPLNADQFDAVVTNLREVTTTWGDENPESIWAIPNRFDWYGRCALPARWGQWNGRYSLALEFVNDFFMLDGSEAPEFNTWFENKQFSDAAAANGSTIAETFHMFVDREPRFYASVHFPNMRVSYAFPDEDHSKNKYTDGEGYGIVDFWKSGVCNASGAGDKNTSGLSPRKNIPLDYYSNKADASDSWWEYAAFPIIRYAEILLNYAEALNEYYEDGKDNEILDCLNQIRNRAGIPSYTGSYTQDELREMIRHERKIELCYETNRFFDVRRWFIAHGPEGVLNNNVLGFDMAAGESATDPAFFTPVEAAIKRFDLKHYFMPIKASEVMLNTELVQAPFY